MKKTLIVGFAVISLLMTPFSAFAKSDNNDSRKSFRQEVEDKLNQLRENREERQVTQTQNKLDKEEERNENKAGKLQQIIDGTVTAINGTTLTVEKNGTSYTVLTDSSTKCRRHFWGKCSISEIAVNDKVNVWGKSVQPTVTPSVSPTVTNSTTIKALMIRDLSQMKRFGVMFGEVTEKSNNTFVIKTVGRGNQTVYVTSSIKWINRKEQTITYADVQIGHRVRVRGLWDKVNSTITEVKEVKDFSIPPQVSGTPEPTTVTSPAPTATNTPTPTTPTNTPTPTLTPTPTI